MEFVRQTIDINGYNLGLARGGKGAPLLYLHGPDGLGEWRSSSTPWRSVSM